MKPPHLITISPEALSAMDVESCVPRLGVGRDRFTLYTEGDELFDAMLAEIAAARRQVLLETYIFAADEVGNRFAAALAERARSGVEVRLMVDALGSMLLFPRRVERILRDSGVNVRRFHRWQWREPMRYNRRDHRKLLVVDGHEAFLGGFNIHRQGSWRIRGEGRWRDTHARVTGDMAAQAVELFDAFWRGERHAMTRQSGVSSVLLSNHTHSCRRRLECIFDAMFADARTSLLLTTPYFVPSRRMRQALQHAVQRGVDVRLLVPRISDVRLARWAARAIYGELLQAGVRIFEYLPRLLHAKTAVADRDWVLMGTANLDYRSVFLNYELILASRDPGLCRRLRDQFDADLVESREVKWEHWYRRGWNARLAEWLAWGLRHWL